jgi:hypothetical protein
MTHDTSRLESVLKLTRLFSDLYQLPFSYLKLDYTQFVHPGDMVQIGLYTVLRHCKSKTRHKSGFLELLFSQSVSSIVVYSLLETPLKHSRDQT